ncbi:MAG: hypothetical protein LBO04_04330 [Spirochaetaceae bacterium]|jgi:hypothetical protein|nr:hypothetical protein [Spirochaetaceae bacterium]
MTDFVPGTWADRAVFGRKFAARVTKRTRLLGIPAAARKSKKNLLCEKNRALIKK